MRGRGLQWFFVLAVSLAAIILGTFAWVDGGKRPVGDIVMPIAVPELPQ